MLRVASTDPLAADALWALGAIAVTEGTSWLDAGFATEAAERDAARELSARWAVDAVDVDEGRWADEWRAWARPVREGPVVVRPAWIPGEGIAIDPGRSFGIGSHPTTRLALRAVVRATRSAPVASMLDVGTGTGVLAIAAAILRVARVVAIDTDEAAVEVTRRNAAANGVDERVDASATPLDAVGGRFDLVVANLGGLLLPVQLAPAMAQRTVGRLVVSGLLDPESGGPSITPLDDEVRGHGFDLDDVSSLDGWCAATWVRTS